MDELSFYVVETLTKLRSVRSKHIVLGLGLDVKGKCKGERDKMGNSW